MAQIVVDIRGLDGVRGLLSRIAEAASDPGRPLKAFGVHMVRSVQRNFDQGGRPVRWIPSRRAVRQGGKTLVDKARLVGSIVSRLVDRFTVAVGTSVRYAGVHQFGFTGQQTVPDTVRVVRQAFGKPITPRRVLFKAHRRMMRIPARPFLVVQEEDRQILVQMLQEHLDRVTRRSGGAQA